MIEDTTRIRIRISNEAMKMVEEYQTDNGISLSLAVEQIIIEALGGSNHENKNQ